MTITRNFKLCLNAGTQNAPYINANQYDEGEEWVFDLYTEGGQKFTPSTGAIIGIKSDGNAILNSGTVNSDGQVVITETQQMTAASGLAVFELLIEGETHGTANFIVNVERRPSDDAEFSDSDLSMLQEAIDAAEVINEILDEGGDPSEIITENVNAWLDNHPEATTTVQDGAITAPKINNSLWDKILVNEEASGAVASFDDGADDVPVSSLKVALEPIQIGSGDPSPTNIRPISGHTSASVQRTGKNLIDNKLTTSTSRNVTATVNADKSVYLNGTASSSGYFTMDGGFASARAELLPWMKKDGTRFIMSGGNGQQLIFYTEDGTSLSTITVDSGEFTIPNDAVYYGYFIRIQNGTAYDRTIYPMIRLASDTDGTYEPYQGQTVTIDLNGTRYGGTLDVTTGVLTVTWGTITLDGSESWQGTPSTGWYTDMHTLKKYKSNYVGAIYADKLVTGREQGAISGYYDNSDAYPTQNWLYYYKNTFTTASEAKSYFQTNPTQIVYELATPTTIQLTPTQVKTLLGYNNISSTGTVDVIYHADTKLYIDKKIGELS